MQRDFRKYTIYDNMTPVAVASSTNASPSVITATAHGFSVGQRIMIQGHTTNTAVNGIWIVATVPSANTFTIQDEFTGAAVAGNGVGASGICFPAPYILPGADFRDIIIEITTMGTATTTLKVAGTSGRPDNATNAISPRKDMPNFGSTVNAGNGNYSFLQVINLDTGAAVNGVTGIVVGGTDINNQYEINFNVQTYIAIYPITWTAGAITVVAILANNQ